MCIEGAGVNFEKSSEDGERKHGVIPVSQPPVHGLAPSKGLLEEDFST